MKQLNIGVVGCGQISDAYFKASQTFAAINIVACADLNQAAAQEKAESYNLTTMTVDEMMNSSNIDLILNLTVPKAHYEVAMQALSHGKHTYSEKPFSLTYEQGRELLEEAERLGLNIGCAPDTFLGGGQQTCRKLIDDGWLGEVVAGTAFVMNYGPERYYHPAPQFFYDFGGGPMFDLGPYYITALVNLLGPVKRVAAITTRGFDERIAGPQAQVPGEKIPVKIPTTLAGTLEFHSGAVINVMTSFDVWKHNHSPLELYGTLSALQVPDPNTFDGPVKLAPGGRKVVEWSEVPVAHIYTDNMRSIGVADMATAIVEGREARCSGRLACHVLEVMESFAKSSNSGSHITLQSSCQRPAALPLGLRMGEV